MKKTKLTAIMVMCAVLASAAAGCGSLSSKDKVDSTLAADDTVPASTDIAAGDANAESNSNAGADNSNLDSIEALDAAAGFNVTDLGVEGYTPETYSVDENGVAQITYNHDGNQAVLRESKNTLKPIAQITGTGSVATCTIIPGVDTNIEQSDNTYIAEWVGVDKEGLTRRFSFTEENVDEALFESTLTSYGATSLAEDQTATSEENSEGETVTDEFGNVVTTESSEDGIVGSSTDNLNTYTFNVTTTGTYEFTDPVSDNDTYWDIYVLDSAYTDQMRLLPQQQTAKGQTPATLNLTAGQYVYCICNKNQWTTGESVDCKLTIKKVDGSAADSGNASGAGSADATEQTTSADAAGDGQDQNGLDQ